MSKWKDTTLPLGKLTDREISEESLARLRRIEMKITSAISPTTTHTREDYILNPDQEEKNVWNLSLPLGNFTAVELRGLLAKIPHGDSMDVFIANRYVYTLERGGYSYDVT